MKKPQVIFVTSVFGEVHNGPALYANYLWEAFRDDPDLNFHLITPVVEKPHPNLHESGTSSNSRRLYELLQKKALEIASGMKGPAPIIHSNSAHCMSILRSHDGPLAGQINDYDAARAFSESGRLLFRDGMRRFASLAWRNLNEQKALSFADCIVCNSEFVRDQIRHRYRSARKTRLEVIHKALDVDKFLAAEPTEWCFESSEGRKLLFVGSNWANKGLDIAIKALAMMPTEYGDLQLLVAGQASSGKDSAMKLVSQLKLQDRVQFLGHVSRAKLPSLYQEAELLVFPSHNEAFGVTVLEALASGVPVVASNVGGVPEILGTAKHSVLVAQRTPIGFANAIKKVLSDPASKDEIANEGESIARQFSTKKMIASVKSLYVQLANSAQDTNWKAPV